MNRNKGEIRFAKPNKTNKGAVLIGRATAGGKAMFEMAPQKSVAQGDGNASFNYDASQFFSLDFLEAADLVLMHKEAQSRLLNHNLLNEIRVSFSGAALENPNLFTDLKKSFMHRKGKSPKDIIFEPRLYNGAITYRITIFDKQDQGKNINMNLGLNEMEIISANLRSYYETTLTDGKFPSMVVDQDTNKSFNLMLPKLVAGDYFGQQQKLITAAQYDNKEYKMVYFIKAV